MQTRSKFFDRRTWKPPILSLLAFACGGCDIVYQPHLSDYAVTPAYQYSIVKQVVLGHDIKVEVYGNQFGVAPMAFAGHVAAEMDLSGFMGANFTTKTTTREVVPYRIVWDFRPPHKSISPDAVCRTHSAEGFETAGGYPIDVYAAFCRDDDALTSIRGALYYTPNDMSIEFVDLIDKMTLSLFPEKLSGFGRRSGDLALAPPPPRPGR